MKTLFVSTCLILALIAVPSIHADELGLLVGGGVDIDDSYDAISFTPFYSATRRNSGQPFHFYSPLTFQLGVGLPSGQKVYGIGYIPSMEYDIRVSGNDLFVAPSLGAGLWYQRSTTAALKLNTVAVSVQGSVHVKYYATEKIMLRVSPVTLNFIPWTYTDGNVGSDIGLSVQYSAMAGVSYVF